MRSDKWESPPQQEPGSMDCEYFAAAYISRAIGHSCTWEDVKRWRQENPRMVCEYPRMAHGAEQAFHLWGECTEEALANWKTAHANSNPKFRQWIEKNIADRNIGFASYHTVKEIGHAVPLLDCNETGVYLADSCHGLIWVPWERFINPFNSAHEMARVYAWYRIAGDIRRR